MSKLISVKHEKNTISLSSAELAERVAKVNFMTTNTTINGSRAKCFIFDFFFFFNFSTIYYIHVK